MILTTTYGSDAANRPSSAMCVLTDRRKWGVFTVTLLCLARLSAAAAGEISPAADAASVQTAAAEIPFSSFASREAQQALVGLLKAPPEPDFHADVAAVRRFHRQRADELLSEARKHYAVSITSETIGGVRADVVEPEAGVTQGNRGRVLLNLHGGGFMWGAGSGALVEAVPIAATGRIKVIAVDYRMAPEHKFPAASEDVAAVYRALLKTYRAENIGLYGCSAGGILAAQSVAWFAAHGLPQPGAIVSLCATGAELDGDSAHLAPLLAGQRPVPPRGRPLHLVDLPYFKDVEPGDPLAFPIASPQLLAKFPPTLLIAGSRDFSASSLTVMHRRLSAAGVDTELFLFDGLWHAFMMMATLPESREVYAIVDRFFDSRLGRRPRCDPRCNR